MVHGPRDQAALNRVVAQVKTQPNVASVSAPILIPEKTGGEVAIFNVYPHSAPQDAATTTLINHLRTQTVPNAVGHSSLTVYIGGLTAVFLDFAHVLSSKLPLFIGLVVLLSFLLLALVFRSLVIPLISAAMNMLSIGAAFGILVAVFQWGWLGSLFGVSRPVPSRPSCPSCSLPSCSGCPWTTRSSW